MVKINVLDLENLFLLVSSFWCRENFGPIIIIFHFCFCHALFAARRRIILVTQNVERIPKRVKSYPKEWKVTPKCEKLPKSVKSYPKVWKDTKNVERIPKRVKSYPKCWKVTKRLKMLPKSVKSYPKCWVKSYPNVLNGFQASIAIGLCFLFVLFRYSNIWGIHGLIQPATNSLTSQASILPIDRYHTM